MAATWQHNYWFWVAAACAVAGASAEWGPQWLAVEQPVEESTPGRPVEVIRHPGYPPSHGHSSHEILSPSTRPALAAPFSSAAGNDFPAQQDSFPQLPQRPSVPVPEAGGTDEVRVAEFQYPFGMRHNDVEPVGHRPTRTDSSPVRLTGKIELIFDE